MKQKDLITYGLIGLALWFLMKPKETKESTTDTGNGDGPELATGGGSSAGQGNNAQGGTFSTDGEPGFTA